MLNRFKENITFLIPFLLFIIISIFILLNYEQGDALKYFSNNRTTFGDDFFKIVTQLAEEKIYILLILLALFFVSYKLAIMIPTMALTVMILSYGLKQYFFKRRPVLYFREMDWLDEINFVDGVHVIDGNSSFPSGHTMSGFALFGLISLYFKNKILSFICLIFALLVGISRIYLFQHFVKDVLFGAVLGVLVAYIIDYIFNINNNKNHWWNNRLIDRLKKK